jgi:hypothetical protein
LLKRQREQSRGRHYHSTIVEQAAKKKLMNSHLISMPRCRMDLMVSTMPMSNWNDGSGIFVR